MNDMTPDLAPGLKSAFTASLATRSNHLMLALALRMAENWAADAARAKIRRAKIDGIGMRHLNNSPPSDNHRSKTEVRANTECRKMEIVKFLHVSQRITVAEVVTITRMHHSNARKLLGLMVYRGILIRADNGGRPSVYRMADGVTP